MRRFAALLDSLERADGGGRARAAATARKVEAVAAYLRQAPAADAAWGLFLLAGGRLPALLSARRMRTLAETAFEVPPWLFVASRKAVGDLAETAASLGAGGTQAPPGLGAWIDGELTAWRRLDPAARDAAIVERWRGLPRRERLLVNRILLGRLRTGVTRPTVIRGVAAWAELAPAVLEHRLDDGWHPSAAALEALRAEPSGARAKARPRPFARALPLGGDDDGGDGNSAGEEALAALGARADFRVEWRWAGARAQLIRSGGAPALLWSADQQLLGARFPEVTAAADARLPEEAVVDGIVVPWRDGRPAAAGDLERRLARARPDRRLLAAAPVVFIAFDLLAADGTDLRDAPLSRRAARLEAILARGDGDVGGDVGGDEGGGALRRAEALDAGSWQEVRACHAAAREHGTSGVTIKRLDAVYGQGWWAWPAAPLLLDTVLLYAEIGRGARGGQAIELTFGVWDGAALVPVGRTADGLAEEQRRALARWVRRHVRERFGPVRAVAPEQVFTLAFDAVEPAPRRKAGLTLRGLRIHRWRRDRAAGEADTLAHLRALAPPGPR